MKVLAITLAVIAAAFAVDLPNIIPPQLHNNTLLPVVNSTEVPLLNLTTTALPPVNVSSTVLPVVNGSSTVLPSSSPAPPKALKAREARFLSLVNGYYYDRQYDVVLNREQYYYVVNQPVYSVSRNYEVTLY